MPVSDTKKPLNIYGDRATFVAAGHGADIASQREDQLDGLALAEIRRRVALRPPLPVKAWDMGCGAGGQAIRMARNGALVTAIDSDPAAGKALADTIARSEEAGLARCVDFRCFDIADLAAYDEGLPSPDLILSQRTIHYFPWDTAVGILSRWRSLALPGAHLYLSASGLDSELGGPGYADADKDVRQRFARITPALAVKHGILQPVCLYREKDMAKLFEASGWSTLQIFSSPFGNIKAVALCS